MAALGVCAQDAREEVNLGVAAFKSADYRTAAKHFSEAVRLAPDFTTARLYLGAGYMMMYVPGEESAENLKNAQLAVEQFRQVLSVEPENESAIGYLANLYMNQKKFDEAAEWNKKLLAVNPDNKEACYTLGVIAWSQCYPALMKARAGLGMKPEDAGPIPDPGIRRELKSRWGDNVEQGIQYLEKALGIDPAYDDAMAYMNLLIRERADLADSKDEYLRDVASADDWVQKALETKKRKAEARPPRP